MLNAYKYFIQYAANVQKDKNIALDYVNKYLVKEPTDAEMISIQKQLTAAPAPKQPAQRPAAAKPPTGTKPAGGTQPAASNTKPVSAPGKSATTTKKK